MVRGQRRVMVFLSLFITVVASWGTLNAAATGADSLLTTVEGITSLFKIVQTGSYKSAEEVARSLDSNLATLSQMTLTADQEKRYRAALEWVIYSHVVEEFYGADTWATKKTAVQGYYSNLGVLPVEPTNLSEWITLKLRPSYRVYESTDAATIKTLADSDKVMSESEIITKLTELVTQRLDFYNPNDLADDSVLGIKDSTKRFSTLEDIVSGWRDLRQLLSDIAVSAKFSQPSRTTVRQLATQLDAPITMDERTASLGRIVTGGILDTNDLNSGQLDSMKARVARLILAVTRDTTVAQRQAAAHQIRLYLNRNFPDTEIAELVAAAEMLERDVIPTELFHNGDLVALRYRETTSSTPVYCQIVKDETGLLRLKASGTTLADDSSHLIAHVEKETGYVGFTTKTKIAVQECALLAGVLEGSPIPPMVLSTTIGKTSSENDLAWFVPSLVGKLVAFKSINATFGFISVDNDALLRTRNKMTGEPSGSKQDNTLTAAQWSQFEVVKVPDYFVRLSQVRTATDEEHIEQYRDVARTVAVLTGDFGKEARRALVDEIGQWVESKKQTTAGWERFTAPFSDLAKGYLTATTELASWLLDTFKTLLPTEPELKTAISDLQVLLVTPPGASVAHPDAPPAGVLVALRSYVGDKYLRAVKDETGADSYYFKADADDPLDSACHLTVVSYLGKLGFASKFAKGNRLQESALTKDEARWMGEKVRERQTRLSFGSPIMDNNVAVSFRSDKNVREQFSMSGSSAASRGKYALTCLAFDGANITIDKDGFARVRSWDTSSEDLKVISATDVNTQLFDIVPLTPFHVNLGAARQENDLLKRLGLYVGLVAQAETDDDVLWLITEVFRFFATQKDTKTSWDTFTKSDAIAAQVKVVLDAISGIVTSKSESAYKNLQGLWESPFTGKLADGATVVLTWQDASGTSQFVRMGLVDSDTGEILSACADGQELLDPATQFRVKVFADSKIAFRSYYNYEEETLLDQTKPALMLQVNDSLVKKVAARVRFVKEPAEISDAYKFTMVGPEESAGFKSATTGSFLSVSAIDQSLSTLDLVTGNTTGLSSGGRYYPSVRESFAVRVLSTFELTLGTLRLVGDGESSKVSSYLSLADQAKTDEEKDEVIAEVDRWIRMARANEGNWTALKDGTVASIVPSLIASLKKIATSSQNQSRVDRITQTWTGVSGDVIPTDAQIVAVSVMVNGERRYLQLVPETEGGQQRYSLSATTTSAIDAAAQFKVTWQDSKLGLVSSFADGRRLRVPVLASDAAYWADAARARNSRITAEVTQRTKKGTEIKFTDDQNLCDQLIMDTIKSADSSTGATLFRLHSALYNVVGKTVQGYLRVDAVDGAVRAVNYSTLAPLAKADGSQFEFVAITPFHTDLGTARDTKDAVAKFKLYSDLVNRAKSDIDVALLFTEISRFISEQKTSEASWTSFASNTTLISTINELLKHMAELFADEIKVSGSEVKRAYDALVHNYTTPFAQMFKDGARIALKWTDKNGKAWYLRLVKEVEKGKTAYLFKADGEDLLDTAAGLKVAVADDGTVELQTRCAQQGVIAADKVESVIGLVEEPIKTAKIDATPQKSGIAHAFKVAIGSIRRFFGSAATLAAAVLVPATLSADTLSSQISVLTPSATSTPQERVYKLKILESDPGAGRGNRLAAQFLAYDDSANTAFRFTVEGSPSKASLKSVTSKGFLSVGKSDLYISTIDELTRRPAGMTNGDRLIPTMWETFEIVELKEFALMLGALRSKWSEGDAAEVVENAKEVVAQYISAIEQAKEASDRVLLIDEASHWVSYLTAKLNRWEAIKGDELVTKFAEQFVLGLTGLADTAALKTKVAAVAAAWDQGFLGEAVAGVPAAGSSVALLSLGYEYYYAYVDLTNNKIALTSDPNSANSGDSGRISLRKVWNNDATFDDNFKTKDVDGIKRWMQKTPVKRFLKAEQNRGLGGTYVMRASFAFDPTLAHPRYDHPFDAAAQFVLLTKGNRIGLQLALADSKHLSATPITDTSLWIASKKYNESCAQFKSNDFDKVGDNPEHFVLEWAVAGANLRSLAAKGYLSIRGADRYLRVLNPDTEPMVPFVIDAAKLDWTETFTIVPITRFHMTIMASRKEAALQARIKLLEDALYAVQTPIDLELMVGELEYFYDAQGVSKEAWLKFYGDKTAYNNFIALASHERFAAADVTPALKERIKLFATTPLPTPTFEVEGMETEVLTFHGRHQQAILDLETVSATNVADFVKTVSDIAHSRSEPRLFTYVSKAPATTGGNYEFSWAGGVIPDLTSIELKTGVLFNSATEVADFKKFLESRVKYNKVVTDAGLQKSVNDLITWMTTPITYAERVEHLKSMLSIPAFSEDRKALFYAQVRTLATPQTLSNARTEKYDLEQAKDACRIGLANQLAESDDFITNIEAEIAKMTFPIMSAVEFLSFVQTEVTALSAATGVTDKDRETRAAALVEVMKDWQRSLILPVNDATVINLLTWKGWIGSQSTQVVGMARMNINRFKPQLESSVIGVYRRYPTMQPDVDAIKKEVDEAYTTIQQLAATAATATTATTAAQ